MKLTDVLPIKLSIIQAPMAGVTTPEFVAASANAGALGSIGAGYLSANETRDFILQVKALTNEPFSVNLFVPEHTERSPEDLRLAYTALKPIGEELGMSDWDVTLSKDAFNAQIQVLIEENVPVCSFTFGLPDELTIQKLKTNNIYLIGTATTVEEAIIVEQRGLDAVVVQGKEAGGHRGSFHGDISFISIEDLLPKVVAAVKIPVIAAGGITTNEHIAAARSNGAHGVQIGTALLATDESGAHPLHKLALLQSKEGSTTLTKAFSGKYARGLRNRFIDVMADAPIAPYPYQNDLTKKLRSEAASQGKPEFLSMWAGENAHLTSTGTVAEKIKKFEDAFKNNT